MSIARTINPVPSALVAVSLLGWPAATLAAPPATVGQVAPWFALQTITGRRVTRDSLRGRVAVLVVGRTYASAPPCKKWVIALSRETRAAVYQVIVADKPWYIPRGAVMSKIKGFTPPAYHDQVLIEWRAVFADRYRIPEAAEPHVLVIDRRSNIRARLRSEPTGKRLAQIEALVRRLSATSSSRGRSY